MGERETPVAVIRLKGSRGVVNAPECARCGEPTMPTAIMGLGQTHVAWTCVACGRRVGRNVSRHALLAAGIDPDTLPTRPSAARSRATTQPRLF